MRQLIPFLLSIFLMSGCAIFETVESTRIPQSEIRQDYHVSADRHGTRVTVVFYHGNWGKTIDLDAPSRIEYNGREMPEIAPNFLKGTTYEKNFEEFAARHEFVYTNGEGAIYRNRMSFEPIEIAVSDITLSRSANTLVPLTRRVRENEKVSLYLSSQEKRPETGFLVNSGNGGQKSDLRQYELSLHDELDDTRTAVVLQPKNLRKFVAGKAVLKIEISRRTALQEANETGGSMNWSYGSSAEVFVEN